MFAMNPLVGSDTTPRRVPPPSSLLPPMFVAHILGESLELDDNTQVRVKMSLLRREKGN